MTGMPFDHVLELARKDDGACREALLAFADQELVGELIVQVYRTVTPAAREAVHAAMERPFQRGWWQGFKRVYKIAEAELDAETFARAAALLDRTVRAWPITQKTIAYLQRRSYRHLKDVAKRAPDRFMDHVEALVPRYAGTGPSVLLGRLLRTKTASERGLPPISFEPVVARVENPFASYAPATGPLGDDVLDLTDEQLTRATPRDSNAPAPAQPAPKKESAPRVWKGPIFPELWVRDPLRLVALLERTRHEPTATALAVLLRERVGEGLLAIGVERFYALIAHPVRAVFLLALAQLTSRVKPGRLRYDELLVPLRRAATRAAKDGGVDWPVVEDLLYLFSDEAARAQWEEAGRIVGEVLVAHRDAPGAGAIVAFLQGKGAWGIGPSAAIKLAGSSRPDVAVFGRAVLADVANRSVLLADTLVELVKSRLPEDDPDLVHQLLTKTDARPNGYPPPSSFPGFAALVDEASDSAFAVLRRALFTFDERGDLPASVPLELVSRPNRRTRALGLDLLSGMLRRGALGIAGVVHFLASSFEDVVTWAREVVREAAAAGRLPNEALYRLLDAEAQDVQGFARRLVREHLARFQKAELIVFLAESPDAATADLGIELYEKELAGKEGFDLRKLVPLFRILLYKVGRARAEKERLVGTLRRWALAAPDNARLAVDVIAEFRRTEAKIDFTRAVTLTVQWHHQFPEVAIPFETAEVFGAVATGGAKES